MPTIGSVEQSNPTDEISTEISTAAVLESDYFASATHLADYQEKIGLNPDSGRTLRRRIKRTRQNIASPYVDIDNIGLTQRIMLCNRDDTNKESPLSRVLHAQAGTFPKARVVSGPNLTLLELQIPSNIEWLELSSILSKLSGTTLETCTFIATIGEKQSRLESVVPQLIPRMPSG